MKVGDLVNYHSIIGEPPTSGPHRIQNIGEIPSSNGQPVAWIEGVSGCVSLDALSPYQHEETGDEPPRMQEAGEAEAPVHYLKQLTIKQGVVAMCGESKRGTAYEVGITDAVTCDECKQAFAALAAANDNPAENR